MAEKKRAILVKPHPDMTANSGVLEVVETELDLDTMYKLLGCNLIEIVPINDRNKLVIDEEGRIVPKGLGKFYFGAIEVYGCGLITGYRHGDLISTNLTIQQVAPFIHWGNL